jgi:hypothetical protein
MGSSQAILINYLYNYNYKELDEIEVVGIIEKSFYEYGCLTT